MRKVKDILTDKRMTLKAFWEVVDSLPDEIDGKQHKKNIRALYKKDGTPKAKALSPSTDAHYQIIHDTQGFIHRQVRKQLHKSRLKERREIKLQNIKDVKEKKDVPRKISKDNKLMSPRNNKGQRRIKRQKEEKS